MKSVPETGREINESVGNGVGRERSMSGTEQSGEEEVHAMQLDMRVNGLTKLTGLIGNPVEHTVSPTLHNSLFSAAGCNGIYLPIKVQADRLKDAVYGLKAAGFIGFNVTIPYKGAILEFLDEISEEAALLEAVNTVKIDGDRLIGTNTDGDGFLRAFHGETGEGFEGSSVCILGAGGTARTLAIKIALKGAGKICIINRTKSSADELAGKINGIVGSMTESKRTTAISAEKAGSNEAMTALMQCDIIINATSVGMHPYSDVCPLDDSFPFRREQIIYDVIYNPAETKLMALARRKGCLAVNGAGMLFYQGVKAFENWMGSIVPEKELSDLYAVFLKYLQG
jgi:shikimate dehydrogenase